MSKDPEYNRRYYAQHKERLAAHKAHRQKHDLDYRLRAVLRTMRATLRHHQLARVMK